MLPSQIWFCTLLVLRVYLWHISLVQPKDLATYGRSRDVDEDLWPYLSTSTLNDSLCSIFSWSGMVSHLIDETFCLLDKQRRRERLQYSIVGEFDSMENISIYHFARRSSCQIDVKMELFTTVIFTYTSNKSQHFK